jgi:ribosome-binding protein aMBF1 (putative translation factor)
MKKRILVVVLCLACLASYGQAKKKKRPAPKKPATTKAAQQQQVANRPTATPPIDTTKRVPMKPFERPLDGYYKKTNI